MFAYRSLGAYPDLTLTVGSEHSDILAGWTRFATLTGLIWLLAAAGVILMCALLFRQSRQREQTELRFRELAQAMPQIVFITDARGHMAFVNDQWTHVTGQPVEAAKNSGWFLRVHPDDLEQTADAFRNAIESAQSLRKGERATSVAAVPWPHQTAMAADRAASPAPSSAAVRPPH